MKTLNFIDLIFQSLVLGLVSGISILIMFSDGLETIGIIAMYGAFFLGPWQLMSSLVTTLPKGYFLKQRKIHLFTSIGYLLTISVLAATVGSNDLGVIDTIGGVIGFAIPIGLALFYYIITIKSFQEHRAKQKQIPV